MCGKVVQTLYYVERSAEKRNSEGPGFVDRFKKVGIPLSSERKDG